MLAAAAAKVSESAERQANLHGMEGYWNQQKTLHQQELRAQGFNPQQVERLANEATVRDMQDGAAQIVNRRTAQKLMAQQTGLAPSVFGDLWTEREMRQRAAQIQALATPAGQQMYQSWVQMQMAQQQLQQGGVPPQNFNRPGSGGYGNNPARMRQQYADGLIPWSPQVQRAIDG
jgi:hypothetical protein